MPIKRSAGALLLTTLLIAVTGLAQPPGDDSPTARLIAAATVLPGDEVRGCCVYATTPVRCAVANKGFCRTSAEEHDVSSRFYANAKCKDVAACPK